MKKITLSLIGIALLFNTIKGQDKAFHKGLFVVNIGVDLSGFKTNIKDEYNNKVWNGSTFGTIRIKKDTTDGAGAAIYPLTIEYGLRNWLGVAARVAYSSYFGKKDSLSGLKTGIRGIDAGFILNFHFIKTSRFDMPIGITFGYSNFKISSNDSLNSIAKGNGFNYGFAVIPRIYFGEHIGLSFNLGYMEYSYPSVLFSNKNNSNLNNTNDRVFKLKTNGANIGVGLLIKF